MPNPHTSHKTNAFQLLSGLWGFSYILMGFFLHTYGFFLTYLWFFFLHTYGVFLTRDPPTLCVRGNTGTMVANVA